MLARLDSTRILVSACLARPDRRLQDGAWIGTVENPVVSAYSVEATHVAAVDGHPTSAQRAHLYEDCGIGESGAT